MGLMLLGDFCMAPDKSLVTALVPGSSVQQTAHYYSTCHGPNPLHQELVNAVIYITRTTHTCIFSNTPSWKKQYLSRDYLGKAIEIELHHGICVANTELTKGMQSLEAMHTMYEWLVGRYPLSNDLSHSAMRITTWICILFRRNCVSWYSLDFRENVSDSLVRKYCYWNLLCVAVTSPLSRIARYKSQLLNL